MNGLFERFSALLEELLVDKPHRVEGCPKDKLPLFLILTAEPQVVVFATLNGQPDQASSRALQNFKKLYWAHPDEWADLDLSLVLCTGNGDRVSDEFRNRVEQDPYFCRKFVVDYSIQLKPQLARLPFIPFRLETVAGLRKPENARAYLLKHGVNKDLARYLTVPHTRGRDRIIEDCIEGAFGSPEWLGSEAGDFVPSSHETAPRTKLKELEITNFRAYRRSFRFDLDADLIVLFGPNGFGKTSFFDALDFVCTGGVARFDERFLRRTKEVPNVLKHLDSPIDDSFVRTVIARNGNETVIERYIKERKWPLVDGVSTDRTETLVRITGIPDKIRGLRIDSFVRLFRATHLFAQEYQTLTPARFKTQSELPLETVSRMLAFQDYVEAENKTEEIIREMEKQVLDAASRIEDLGKSLKTKQTEADGLRETARALEKPERLLAMGERLVQKIERTTGMKVILPAEPDMDATRAWRAQVAAKASAVTQKIESVDLAQRMFPEIQDHQKVLERMWAKLGKGKKTASELHQEYAKRKQELAYCEGTLKSKLGDKRTATLSRDNLAWVLDKQNRLEELRQQIKTEEANLEATHTELRDIISRIRKLKSEKSTITENHSTLGSETSTLMNKLTLLEDLERAVGTWLDLETQRETVQGELEQQKEGVNRLEEELKAKKKALMKASGLEQTNKEKLDRLYESQAELQALLSKIEVHISGSVCPACGAQYESREDLTNRLRARRGIQPDGMKQAFEGHRAAKASVARLMREVAELESELTSLLQERKQKRQKLDEMHRIVAEYGEKAQSLGIRARPQDIGAAVSTEREALINQTEVKQKQLAPLEHSLSECTRSLEALAERRRIVEQSLKTAESPFDLLKHTVKRIEEDALNRQVSLETEVKAVHTELKAVDQTIRNLTGEIKGLQTKRETLRKEVEGVGNQERVTKDTNRELGKDIREKRELISAYEASLDELCLSRDADADEILKVKDDLAQQNTALRMLSKEIIDFDVALDAAGRSVRLDELEKTIVAGRAELRELERSRASVRVWVSYFNNVLDGLRLVRNTALEEYTDKLGPLASTIQARLRSVYGFGDITLHPEDTGIAVRVRRTLEDELPPSDYFSESQIQILMLSVFLSAALTQTWSLFAPILLDDPVEHFDDLNAYSFADLVRGLLAEGNGDFQFLISMCENRLFRLLREKLNKTSIRTIFYLFESLGRSGPEITETRNF